MVQKLEEKLGLLKQQYLAKLPSVIHDIKVLWNALCDDWDHLQICELHRQVHSISGTSGIYGLTNISHTSRDLERFLNQFLENPPADRIQKQEVQHLLMELEKSVNQPLTIDHIPNKAEINELLRKKKSKTRTSRVIYLISMNTAMDSLVSHFSKKDYLIKIFVCLNECMAVAQKQIPDIIIVDEITIQHSTTDILARYIKTFNIPLIYIATQEEFDNKLQAVRCGAAAILKEPISIDHLLETVDMLLEQTVEKVIHVLIVDDSVFLSQYYQTILQEADMFVAIVNEPKHLFETLRNFTPDVVVIDFYLPDCTGIEIASMLRLDPQYKSLPIIFASTENNPYTQFSIINYTGAELFLSKPILPQNLIAAIQSKAKYGSVIQNQILKDGLTNLFNHAHILQCLALEIERSKRSKENFVAAMIDLDSFKKINDTHGHLVGDHILKKMTMLLTANIRRIDILGRYGGDEFLLILTNITEKNAQTWCEKIRKVVADTLFAIDQLELHLTVSIGLASSADYLSAEDIIRAADNAMYAAKRDGHNRVCIAKAPPTKRKRVL